LTKEKIKSKTIKLTLSQKIDYDFKKFGKVAEQEGLYVKLIVNNNTATEALKTIVNELPIEDITIEDPDAEEIIRNVFEDNRNI
jgi:ABC-type uncharacterized transport system ATPase subunit